MPPTTGAATKPKLGFSENFLLSGTAAALAKTSAAPIERVKLLLQNQGELLKQGRLDRGYSGVRDCVVMMIVMIMMMMML